MARSCSGFLTALAVVAGLFVAGILFLFVLFGPRREVVATVPSPDGKFEAVLVEVDGGATTSFGYDVHIREVASRGRGHKVAYLYGATRNEHAYGANLRWSGNRRLSIEFDSAKWTEETDTCPEVGGARFDVKLVDGMTDASAPSGGMHYHLLQMK